MSTNPINLFIVDDDDSMLTLVKNHLIRKFGHDVNITTFNSGEACLEHINYETHIVILDYYLNGENGLDILQLIKTINPHTEVIMLSNNEDMVAAIEAFKRGAREYVIKNTSSLKKISELINKKVVQFRTIVAEPNMQKFAALFFLTFATLAIVVTVIVKFYNKD
ncbi:MAG: response regulator [Bacteroidia bacterium]